MSDINNNGKIKISTDVIGTIVYNSMIEIDGVYNCSNSHNLINKIFKKNLNGINITIDKNENINININLIVKINYNVNEVARNVQNKVKTAVETMTGLNVNLINVKIIDIDTSKECENTNY